MGLLDILGSGLGATPPQYMEGLLGQQATDDLRKRSIGTGLVNALVGYAAMPKNQNLGLGRILAGAAQSGMQGAQGVYDNATNEYMQAQKIAEMKRKQEQDQAMQSMLSGITDPNERLLANIDREAYVKSKLTPRERKTATIGNKLIDVSTGEEIYAGEKELKAPPIRERQVGRTKIQEELQADGTWREIGKGSMDAPQQAKEISYKTETGADGNLYYVPNKPNSPVLDATGKPTNAYKPTGAKPTADERKANTLLTRMEGSLSQLNQAVKENPKAAKPEYLPTAIKALSFGMGEIPANLATSAERQRAEAAQLDIVDAALTLGTGAAYTKEQLEGYRKSYFPQIGDSDAQIADKAARRENLINAARIAAGKSEGGAVPQQAQAKPVQQMPAVGTRKSGFVFLGGNPNDPKSWKKE